MFECYRNIIEDSLIKLLRRANLSPILCESMEYSLIGGGKRIRPCLMLSVTEMLGGDLEKAIPFACALEMIQSYSLVHDDLPAMDNDDYRRGKLSCHKKYGEANGILAGDGLLTEAALILAEQEGYDDAKASILNSALVMVSGQSYDLNESAWSEELLHLLHLQKTGALFCAATTAGAYLAGRPELVPSFAELGKAIGLIFQITDDFLDAEKDALSKKLTFYTYYGKEKSLNYLKDQEAAALKIIEPFQNAASEELQKLIRSLADRKE